jgi:hypothetical protein
MTHACHHAEQGLAMTTPTTRLTGLLAAIALPTWAQSPAGPPAPDPCRTEVSKFEQAIGFIRQTQGNQAAADLKEELLPAKVENDILFKDGYCGLARYLREKKLNK